jgi:hypothetical protein
MPGVVPQPHDRAVAGPPGLGELVECRPGTTAVTETRKALTRDSASKPGIGCFTLRPSPLAAVVGLAWIISRASSGEGSARRGSASKFPVKIASDRSMQL